MEFMKRVQYFIKPYLFGASPLDFTVSCGIFFPVVHAVLWLYVLRCHQDSMDQDSIDFPVVQFPFSCLTNG